MDINARLASDSGNVDRKPFVDMRDAAQRQYVFAMGRHLERAIVLEELGLWDFAAEERRFYKRLEEGYWQEMFA